MGSSGLSSLASAARALRRGDAAAATPPQGLAPAPRQPSRGEKDIHAQEAPRLWRPAGARASKQAGPARQVSSSAARSAYSLVSASSSDSCVSRLSTLRRRGTTALSFSPEENTKNTHGAGRDTTRARRGERKPLRLRVLVCNRSAAPELRGGEPVVRLVPEAHERRLGAADAEAAARPGGLLAGGPEGAERLAAAPHRRGGGERLRGRFGPSRAVRFGQARFGAL